MISHRLIKHAAHYMYDHPARGHDIEQWVTASGDSTDRPSFAARVAVGVAPDADYHSGYVKDGRQHWVWVAKRPFSSGTCGRCTGV